MEVKKYVACQNYKILNKLKQALPQYIQKIRL